MQRHYSIKIKLAIHDPTKSGRSCHTCLAELSSAYKSNAESSTVFCVHRAQLKKLDPQVIKCWEVLSSGKNTQPAGVALHFCVTVLCGGRE